MRSKSTFRLVEDPLGYEEPAPGKSSLFRALVDGSVLTHTKQGALGHASVPCMRRNEGLHVANQHRSRPCAPPLFHVLLQLTDLFHLAVSR